MKKFKVLLIAMMCACLVGCGTSGGVSQEEYDSVVAERDALQERVNELEAQIADSSVIESTTSEQSDSAVAETPSDVSDNGNDTALGEDIEIVAEYTLDTDVSWYTRHFLVIKNNSDKTLDVKTSSLAYGDDGAIVGAADASFDALGAGCTSVMYEAFDVDAEISYYETEISSSEAKYYESVIQDLAYVENDIEKGAVFQVTNNGEDAARFVEGYALFFMGDELVYYDRSYYTDDDSEIKPGKTISKQLDAYEDFDRIEFYMSGRK